MKIRSYQERGIQFSFVTLQTSEILTQQELFDYLFNGQSLCPPDSIYQKGDKLVMETCSGNGLIEFSFASEQISGQADTSLAGPGFHRAVVLLLDQHIMSHYSFCMDSKTVKYSDSLQFTLYRIWNI